MGKASRWLKALFGYIKEQSPSYSGDRKDKFPSCIGRSHRNSTISPPQTPLKPLHNNSDDQKNRAIAVANATAVAAEAAVAAAQAAVEFVRLTSQNRFTTTRVNSAAIKIQALFRGFLARKALKALKSLVKLQAAVRGYLVRKEAAETLQGMEALIRAQSSVSAHRLRLQDDKFHSKKSMKRANEAKMRRKSSFQAPIDGISKSRLTRANTWAWDSEAQSPHFSLPFLANHHEFDPRYFTTHNTPRFTYSFGSNSFGSLYKGISKDDSFVNHPGYMANTKSFRAKARSKSAPKQRPDFGLGPKKGVVLNEVECGPKSKSPSLLEVNNFKNFVMSRIGKSSKVQWE